MFEIEPCKFIISILACSISAYILGYTIGHSDGYYKGFKDFGNKKIKDNDKEGEHENI